ncbi:MAG: oligosaccharide flippase family protein [Dysgonomonas sp.]
MLFCFFFCIPIFINKLGDEQYGIFCIISVIGNLTVFANLSLDSTLVKFLTEQGKCETSSYDIVIALSLMLLIILPLSLILIIFKSFILLNLLNIPPQYLTTASYLFVYLVIANIILLVGKVFTSILESQHKIYLINLAMFIYNIIYWLGIIVLVIQGYGLEQIGANILIAAVVWFLIVFILAFKNWGKIELLNIKKYYKFGAKKQLKYTSKIFAGSFLSFMHEPLTKILISNLLGVSFVGYFDIAQRIKSQLFTVFIKLISPLYPTIGCTKDKIQITTLVNKATEYLFYIIIPIFTGIIFCSYPVIKLWIGGDNTDMISLSTIILVGTSLLFSVPAIPIYYFIRIKDHAEKEIIIQATNAIINVIVIIALYKHIGYYSILLGNALSMFCSFMLCIYYQKRYLKIIPFSNRKDKIQYISCAILIVCITGLFSYFYKVSTVYSIFIELLFITALTATVFYFFKIFKKIDFKLS